MSRKIAYLTGEYPRATDTFIQREVAALRKLGMNVQTCSVRRTGSEHIVGPEQAAEQAQTFHILEHAKSLPTLGRALLFALKRPKQLWATLRLAYATSPAGMRAGLWQVFYLLEAIVLAHMMAQRDITHLHNHIAKASCTVAMLASELSGIPFSFTLHGPDIFYEPHHWRLDEKIARAAFVACISDFCRSQAMVFSGQVQWDKLHIIHCGIEPERYADTGKPDGKRLLFVGRLAAVKGVAVLLDALLHLKDTHPDVALTLIGDGPERAALETKCKELGLEQQVTFLGYQNQSAVAAALADHDIFVLPSFAEGVPVVLMEAMAAGRPVVTTRIAGVPELVEDGVSGILVPPGNQDALGTALETLLSSTALATMGAAGREKVTTDFAIATEAAKLAKLIEEYGA